MCKETKKNENIFCEGMRSTMELRNICWVPKKIGVKGMQGNCIKTWKMKSNKRLKKKAPLKNKCLFLRFFFFFFIFSPKFPYFSLWLPLHFWCVCFFFLSDFSFNRSTVLTYAFPAVSSFTFASTTSYLPILTPSFNHNSTIGSLKSPNCRHIS